MNDSQQLDAVIIAGYLPDEYLGKEVREKVRLSLNGKPASLRVLHDWFKHPDASDHSNFPTQEETQTFLSINGPYLCQFLADHDFTCELVPFAGLQQARLAELLARQPQAVVLSTTFMPFAAQIDALAAEIKRLTPASTLVVGGVQVWKSYCHRNLFVSGAMTQDVADAVAEHSYFLNAKRRSPADLFIVSRTGETTLARLLACLRAGSSWRHLDNLAWQEGHEWHFNPITEDPPHVAQVNWRAFVQPGAAPYVPVQAGQGCGRNCNFCDFAGLRPIAARHTRSILAEIDTIPVSTDGFRRVFFTDDNLFPTRSRLLETCTALASSPVPIRWRGMFRLSIVDNETADSIAHSGCLEALLGIESGDPDMLARMGKTATPEKILQAIEALARRGIHTKSTFIVGFPGETEQSIQNTVNLINAYPSTHSAAHRFMFFRFGVLPLSPVATPASRRLYQLSGYGYDWRHHTMDSSQAGVLLEQAYDLIKPEISPSYVLEVPELPGLPRDRIRTIYELRTRLSRLQRGLPDPEQASALWARLQTQFD